ncbi:MAG: hypothetical protein CL470_06085 [Acidimicrobiaceae bacterium]|nr:hypothetical protein [Acidimicrobiaceae bacterium]
MIYPPPFPTSIDQVTDAFLGGAIGSKVSGFQTERIGEDRGMLGEIFKLEIFFIDDTKDPLTIVAKFAAMREETLALAKRGGTHERELRCYDELLAPTPVNVPEMIGSWYDPETAEFLLLQEMIDADISVDQIAGLSEKQAQLVITEMAKLHAFWWRDPILNTKPWLPRLDDQRRRINLTTVTKNGWNKLSELLHGEIPSTISYEAEYLAEEVDRMLCRTAEFPSTFVHSDLRADNLLFSADGSSVAVIDWQGCCIAPPAFDFTYFLIQSMTIEDRQRHEEDLLRFYMEEMNRFGLKIDLDNLREVYRSSLVYSLAIACAVPLINDTAIPRVRELGISMGTRSIQALLDHNQI